MTPNQTVVISFWWTDSVTTTPCTNYILHPAWPNTMVTLLPLTAHPAHCIAMLCLPDPFSLMPQGAIFPLVRLKTLLAWYHNKPFSLDKTQDPFGLTSQRPFSLDKDSRSFWFDITTGHFPLIRLKTLLVWHHNRPFSLDKTQCPFGLTLQEDIVPW